MMKQLITKRPTFSLVPTRECPLRVRDFTARAKECMLELIQGTDMEHLWRSIYLEDMRGDHQVSIDYDWLSMAEIEHLAAGGEFRTPIGPVEEPGCIRLLRGHEGGKFVMVILEFLPDGSVPQDMPFEPWLRLRFPESTNHLSESLHEERWIHFHHLWVAESQPPETLSPCDSLLHQAVLNNQERFLDAILAVQPRIEMTPGMERSITETVLGIAMENTGMFGSGPGFACGCHRRYRDDDFCEAEDRETWVPRAERIAERLKAAGAIDYTPLLAACRAGDADAVEEMLKAGFPPNFSVYGHTTALCEAVQPGHEEICDLLLCYGANPNNPRPFDTSMTFGGEIYPLSLAIEHPAIFKRLLQAGADPNQCRDNLDETPVVFTMKYDSREHAEEIFRMVDFASIRSKHGRSGVFYLDVMQLDQCRNVIPSALLSEPDGRGMTPLLHAITFEDIDKARLLIEMGADPSQPGMIWEDEANCILRMVFTDRIPTQWLTPIQAALQIHNLNLVEFLHDIGAKAIRHSVALKIPMIQNHEEFVVLRDKLQEELENLQDGIRLQVSRYVHSFSDERTRHCEILLATLLVNQPEITAKRYPEWIERIDLAERAEAEGFHPAAIELFRSGNTLGKSGWLQLAEEAMVELQQEIDVFAKAVEEDARNGTSEACNMDLLRALDHAERNWLDARWKIIGKQARPLALSSEACAHASGEFDGGGARARKDATTTGEVGFDDFVDFLKESLEPGTTMDFGKLLEVVRQMSERLQERCVALRLSV